MQLRSLVSLAFFPQHLQFVQINKESTAVTKLALVNIPPATSNQNLPLDTNSLAQIIHSTHNNYNLSEKSVGIVIPETASYVKLLKFPKIKHEELEEAIRWQVNDFFHAPDKESLIFDWKIVEETQDSFWINIAVIRKEVLNYYIDSVNKAGLFPLVVETPSFILSRITNYENKGRIIIYSACGLCILVVANGSKIYGSSVVSSTNQESILTTAHKILLHFSEAEVKEITLGGLDFSKDTIALLQSKLQLPLKWFDYRIGTTPTGQIQEYLLPIHLLRDRILFDNHTHNNINLLPPDLIKTYHDNKFYSQVISLLIITTTIVSSLLITVVSFYLFIYTQYKSLSKEVREQREIPPELISQVAEVNSLTKKVQTIQEATKYPHEIVNTVTKAKPQGITLNSYKIDLESGSLIIGGKAENQEKLIEFKLALDKIETLSSVKIPLSSFEEGADLNFEIDIQFGQPANKSQPKLKVL